MSDVKQVIIIRKDLKMRRGKEIAQGAHAAMRWLTSRIQQPDTQDPSHHTMDLTPVEHIWVKGSFKKVCVYVNSEEELLEIHKKARDIGLLSYLVTDRGLTEFGGVPTNTCIGIGPDDADKIDRITGQLKLY